MNDPDIFFGRPMTAQTLSGWVRDEEVRKKYIEAFGRSDFVGMLNFYKQNYPDIWSLDAAELVTTTMKWWLLARQTAAE